MHLLWQVDPSFGLLCQAVISRFHAIEVTSCCVWCSMQGMDTYSNILYVKEQYVELSHLAHRAAVSEKYRPETCCIIGNYYSLRGHHEKVSCA